MKKIVWPLIALICLAGGIRLGSLMTDQSLTDAITQTAMSWAVRAMPIAETSDKSSNLWQERLQILQENPELVGALARGGGFGGAYSRQVAQDMFTHSGAGLGAAKRLTEIEEIAPRTWHIRLPIVNVVLFETDDGLVVVDTGMGVGGPAVLDAIRSVSDKAIHTIIYTHGHVDHVAGAWALVETGRPIQIVAQENLPKRFERYLRLRGSLAKYMSQPLASMPRTREDFVWPDKIFRDELVLTIGGEDFILRHCLSETDDQLYVWVPSRKAVAGADLYQGFLPNAGNGKRVQRYLEEWATGLRDIVALEPQFLLPGHGVALVNNDDIRENLLVLAEVLELAVNHAIDGLNAGLRKDQIIQSFALPERLANHPTMELKYVAPKDLVKMVIKRYTGWWDDIPSHWTPAPLELEAREIVSLSGGVTNIVQRANELANSDINLASHIADWAFLAYPNDSRVQAMVFDVYKKRIAMPDSLTQEMLAYLDRLVEIRQLQRQGQ